MDEKGCQWGGRQKQSSQKNFVPYSHHPRYWQCSVNLELITIIKCVCADGTHILPGFIFAGKEFTPKWFTIDPKISYEAFTFQLL